LAKFLGLLMSVPRVSAVWCRQEQWADAWRPVLLHVLAYAKSKGPPFLGYTMPRLVDFMTRRLAVKWSQRLNA
jgi:hypothetical protein